MLGVAAAGPGMAWAECSRAPPWGFGLGLLSWCRTWAWAWAWLRAAVAARRRVPVAAWRPSWVSGGVPGAGFVGAWALAAAGLLAVGTSLRACFGGFPCGLGAGVLDEDVVVVSDQVVVVVEVAESEAEERAVRDGGGPWAAEAGVECWVL